MRKKLLLFSMGILFSFSLAKAQSVVINKFYNATNDNDGGGDGVELLVIEDDLSLVGMTLQLNNSSTVRVYTFKDLDLWKNVKAGTLIVLENPTSKYLTPELDDKANFLIRANLGPSPAYFNLSGGSTPFNASQNSSVVIRSSNVLSSSSNIIHAVAAGSGTFPADYTGPKLKASGTLNANEGPVFVYSNNETRSLADFNGTGLITQFKVGSNPAIYEPFSPTILGNPINQNNLDYILSLRNIDNKSLLFDGVDDKVIVKTNSELNPANNLTLEAWIKVPQWKSGAFEGVIISKEESNNAGYALRCGANGKLNFVVGNNGGQWKEITSPELMTTNRWYHVAGVYENINKTVTLKLYINGSLVAQSVTENSWSIKNSTKDLTIGESSGFAGRHFKGNIDEVRVWSTSRKDEEITANMASSFLTRPEGLVAYYRFNQVSGTDLIENFSLSTNKTLTGELINFTSLFDHWDVNYQPSGVDLMASKLISPDQITFYAEKSRIKASFRNFGTTAASNYTVGYQINSLPAVTEVITGPLQPGGELNYSFKTLVQGVDATSSIRVFINSADDTYAANDEITTVYKKYDVGSSDIPVFVKQLQNNGSQTQSTTVVLPDDNTRFKQILMNISVDCPTGGCDRWDQPAKVSIVKNNMEYEVARYVTPYGKACGPWLVDVTDFKSLLKGATEFKSFVQVWGGSGWLVNVSLTFVEGTTAFPYQKITPLWNTDNWVYGDPNKSHDLPEKSIITNPLTKDLSMRMTITGHGQGPYPLPDGNTDNAAEFSDKTHVFRINGVDVQNHRLWKEDCAQNSCSNQGGTWTLSRAGWCPGQAVNPYTLPLTSQLVAGQEIKVDYVLQDYINLGNSGYNGGDHTEPHYKIHAYLIEKSDVPFENNAVNIKAESIAFPTKTADMTATTAIQVVLKNTGTTLVSSTKLYCFVNGVIKAEETSNTPIAPGESFTYTFTTPVNLVSSSAGVMKTISIVSESENDELYSDDIISVSLLAPHETLPLNFTNFNVRLTGGNKASLSWSYQNTESTSVFEIERLNNETNQFELISSITKTATPGEETESYFIDNLPGSGNFYYRIKHTDGNGIVKYSETKVVSVADDSEVLIYPNPVAQDLNVQFKLVKAGEVNIEIFNLSGSKVYFSNDVYKQGSNKILIPVDKLTDGYYIIKIKNVEFNKVISFIKK